MNLGMLFLLFVVAIGAIMGLAFIGSQATANPVIDTYGSGMSAATNNTMNATQGALAAGQTVGGGVIILIALVIGGVILLLLVAVAVRKI